MVEVWVCKIYVVLLNDEKIALQIILKIFLKYDKLTMHLKKFLMDTYRTYNRKYAIYLFFLRSVLDICTSDLAVSNTSD